MSYKENKNIYDLNDGIKNAVENRQVKKFFRIAGVILALEIVAVIALVTYFLILPKNYCKVTTNMKDAIIYINNKKTSKLRLENPDKELINYYYEFDLDVELPDNNEYLITFSVKCDKYITYVTTKAEKQNNKYVLSNNGNKKIEILTGITLISNEKINNFDVNIYLDIRNV